MHVNESVSQTNEEKDCVAYVEAWKQEESLKFAADADSDYCIG